MTLAMASYAQTTATYRDANGDIQTCTAKVIPVQPNSLQGWYVVPGDIEINIENPSVCFNLTGDTHIILRDDCTLTINYTQGDATNMGIIGSGKNLTIYGGDKGTGKLVIRNPYFGTYCIRTSSLTVNGGTLDIEWAAAMDGVVQTSNFTINGGTVIVKLLKQSPNGIVEEAAGGLCMGSSNYYINGGSLYATQYKSTGNVVFGKAFCAGSTLITANTQNMAGRTIYPAATGAYHTVAVPEHVSVTGNGVGYGGNYRYFVPSGTGITLSPETGYGISNIQSSGGTVDGSTITDINGDITVTCNVEPLTDIEYSIEYSLNGGALPEGQTNPTTYKYDTPTFTLVNPIRNGYVFSGWTGTGISSTFGSKPITIEQHSTGDRKYSAIWQLSQYNIQYNLDGGYLEEGVNNPGSYNVGYSKITLHNPVRPGYKFVGWTGSNGETPQVNVEIPGGSTGHRSFKANWEALQYSGFYITTGNDGKTTAVFQGNSTDAITIDNAIDVDNVIFYRQFQKDVYSTIVLPFDASIPEGVGVFYTFGGVTYDTDEKLWVANVVETSSLSANTPYIFKPSNDISQLTWNVSNIKTATAETSVSDPEYGDWVFKGTYSPESWATPDNQDYPTYGFAGSNTNDVSIGDFVRARNNVSIKPFRCYLEYRGDDATLSAQISKSAAVLPDRIEVRIINSVIDPEITNPTDGDDDIKTPVSELLPTANANVWSYDKTIYIAAAPNTPYAIVDIAGRPLKNGITATDRDEIHLPDNFSGIVIVIINGKSFKIKY